MLPAPSQTFMAPSLASFAQKVHLPRRTLHESASFAVLDRLPKGLVLLHAIFVQLETTRMFMGPSTAPSVVRVHMAIPQVVLSVRIVHRVSIRVWLANRLACPAPLVSMLHSLDLFNAIPASLVHTATYLKQRDVNLVWRARLRAI